MKIETILRHVREAYLGVKRNTWMSFAAISTVSVTLFIFGVFLLVAFNVRYMAQELDKQVGITISLNPQLTNKQQKELEKEIKTMPEVKYAEFIPKEKGLKEMKEKWGEDGEKFFKGMEKEGENPLPDIIKVQPKNPQKIKELANKFKNMSSKIDKVDYAEVITKQILSFSSLLKNVVLVFAAVLSLLSAFLISNTIKLTIIARKAEIEIQRLVGASNWFIKWPFFLEGAFIGMVGAILPSILLLILNKAFAVTIGATESTSIIKMMPMTSLAFNIIISLFFLGITIGVWGSIISVRRFLKV